MLQAPNGVREKVMVFGGYGVGKSTCWLKVAEWLVRTGSDAKVFVVDTDDAALAMGALELPNVEVFSPVSWPEFRQATAEVVARAREAHDWMVVDFASWAWELVQDWYVEQMFGDPADYFMSVRQAEAQRMDGWKDWSVINKQYRSFSVPFFFRSKGHILVTAHAETLKETDAKELRVDFSSVGVRPRGQKHLANSVHSVLLLRALKPREVYLYTVKERHPGRPAVEGERMHDFVADYLVKVAGWSL